MEDGFTGLSPQQAKEQLDSFEDAFYAASAIGTTAYINFAQELSTKWYSPKAFEFGDLTNRIMTELYDMKHRVLGTILRNASSSYNIMMRANGEYGYGTSMDNCLEDKYDNLFKQSPSLWWNEEFNIEFKEQGPNGEVGMNTLLAKVLVSEFQKKIDSSIEAFDELPVDIAFYDPDGSLKQAFKDLINSCKETVKEKLGEIISFVNDAMETEIENINIAKQEATDALNVSA